MFQWSKEIDPGQREVWEERLETDALPGLYVEEDVACGSFRVVAVCGDREEADALARRFGGEIASLKEQDWVALGRESWGGRWLEIGEGLVVALDEEAGFVQELRNRFRGRDVLVIPPEMAFGTGDHETTAMCLEEVAAFGSEREPGWSLLDLGTGTAILAMAGLKSGAGRVVGTEVDELALKVAARNLARNGMARDQIELRQEDVLRWEPRERFDLVCANLYAGILEAVLPLLPAALRAGGSVCLSGILHAQAGGVEDAAKLAGFSVLRRTTRGKWVTLLLQRKESLG